MTIMLDILSNGLSSVYRKDSEARSRVTDKKVRPAEVFPPAEYLRDELQARGWTGYDLAARLGWSMVKAGDLLAGRMQITGELADKLGDVFGTSSELWLNLQQTYLRWAP